MDIPVIKALLQALSGKPWLLLPGLSFMVSSVGNGITYIVVFSELIRLSAPVTSLALANDGHRRGVGKRRVRGAVHERLRSAVRC